MNAVTKLRGSAASSEGAQVTLWRVVRDHTHSIFYFQSFADTVWGHIDVQTASHGKSTVDEHPGKTYADINTHHIPLNMGQLGYQSVDVAKEL